ncbi:hypothetical protein GGR52DRAFT_574743 [Hypoxylon sp. FL1284]|nr:hypothetical protein GGR52DRAFT_574743 [Hypoxylon sp. FL1284]
MSLDKGAQFHTVSKWAAPPRCAGINEGPHVDGASPIYILLTVGEQHVPVPALLSNLGGGRVAEQSLLRPLRSLSGNTRGAEDLRPRTRRIHRRFRRETGIRWDERITKQHTTPADKFQYQPPISPYSRFATTIYAPMAASGQQVNPAQSQEAWSFSDPLPWPGGGGVPSASPRSRGPSAPEVDGPVLALALPLSGAQARGALAPTGDKGKGEEVVRDARPRGLSKTLP